MSSRAEINAALAKLKKPSSGLLRGFAYSLCCPPMQFQTYNKDWAQRYSERACPARSHHRLGFLRRRGPAVGACFRSRTRSPFFRMRPITGCISGWRLPLARIKSRTICCFAHDKREFTDDEIEVISAMVRRLHDVTEPPESLTKAQQEALRCIAEGDRHAAAAAKLGITESAFKAQFLAACVHLSPFCLRCKSSVRAAYAPPLPYP